MKILKFNTYNFLIDNLSESTEFADMQLSQLSNPLGPGYGFSQDAQMSIYSDGSSPYIDNYTRFSQMSIDLSRIMGSLHGFVSNGMNQKVDMFLEDIEEFSNLKILRMFINNQLKLDIFISFVFMEEEFFGVYRNFNGINKPKFNSDLLTDVRFGYINKEYYIKLNNYLYKILYNWFIPIPGDYIIINDEIKVKNSLGEIISIPKDSKIYVKGYNTDQDNDPFLIIKYKEEIYKLTKNDYFFFKYYCKKIN
jgi:hypothetical protein